jgi:DNA helicase-2/ATP-dependent DNA helicase PcrA
MDDKFLRQLSSSQRQAVLHTEGPLLVLAGPGSGKTRVITYRIAALIDSGIRPSNICALTFTNKAAEQMRQRARALGASAGAHISTFHSLCVRILRRYAGRAGIKPNFSIYDAADQAGCMKQAVSDCQLDTANFSPARMLDAVSILKNNLKDVESFCSEADDFFSKTLARIYARYQAILAERNSLDFDDLLLKTAFLLRDCPDVCSELSRRFRFLLIDEYQDTNHAQYKIAKALVCEHNNICATGDPDQSIYRWRGADIRNILAFEQDWPDAVVVKLEENFRSTAGILERADKLISANINRKQKKLIPTKPFGNDVIVSVFEDQLEEADGVTARVGQLADEGISLNDIAVFYRVNAQSRVLEESFIRNKIPYQLVRGVEFYSRKEIRDLLGYLKLLVNPDDQTVLLRVINTPARGIGKTTIEKVRSYADSQKITFFDALKKAKNIESISAGTKTRITAFVNFIERFKTDLSGKVAPLAERVFIESGLKKSLADAGADGETALENINELLNSAAQYDQQTEQPTLLDYLQQIALFSDVDAYDAASGRVALMTLHTAKGLEFENVFITGLEEGLLPHEKSRDDPDEIEEERRLFFVGMTRAKTGLYISCAKYRTVWGQMQRTVPSPFLYELGIDFTESSRENSDSSDITQSDFATGRLIRHKVFGLGRVKEFIDMGQDSIVVVQFNSGRTKSLMLKYADLEKA